ncbi:MAG: 50S ribosomal protein L3 [Candidatus Omnitrophica bacterium]|nr:50S ribosomal protein L3 [Candidatus Omnitrophota bacterium]
MLKEIFGKKIGMTQVFTPEGNVIGVTVLEVEPVCVLEKKEYSGRNVAKIGCFKMEEKRINKIKKPQQGYFKKLGTSAYKLVQEVVAEKEIQAKQEVGVEIFNEGEIIDVRGKIKGRGFSGGIKRHGWHGGPQAHGSMTHRRIGSNGANTDPGRVVRGHRMPGHFGNSYQTIRNLKIVKIDKEKSLLFIEGGIPGSRGSVLKVKKVRPLPKSQAKS